MGKILVGLGVAGIILGVGWGYFAKQPVGLLFAGIAVIVLFIGVIVSVFTGRNS
jgi:hypothetical protein